jgi:hypothetical protein
MWKLFALLLLFPLPALAQSTAALAETLCTTDSAAIAPINDNLREGSHTVTLNWTASASTGNSAALWYVVSRGTASGGPYTPIANCVSGTSYVDVVGPSQIFYYVVQAVNAAGSSSDSSPAMALIPTYDAFSDSNTPQETLSVTVLGGGSITSSPSGIACTVSGGTCSAGFLPGTNVTLTETPAASYYPFQFWSGACSGVGSCSVTMSAYQALTATFCGPPHLFCSSRSTATFQTPNTPSITSPLSSGTTCVPGSANGGVGGGCAGSIGYDMPLNPKGLNPSLRATDNGMVSGDPLSPTPSQGANDAASNCFGRGVTPGSTFTTLACQNATIRFIILTDGGCPYVEGIQVIGGLPQIVAPLPATKGGSNAPAACGLFSFSHIDPAISYNVPPSGSPTIYQTSWAWDGTVGHTASFTQTPLYSLQTLCPLPAGFSTTWASSTSTDITGKYFTLALSNVGAQNTGAYMVRLDTTSSTPTCVVYVTGGTTAAAGTEACMGANCPSSLVLAAFAPSCLFTIHDVFALLNAASGLDFVPLSTGGQTAGHTCVTDKPEWQPYGPNLYQAGIKGTVGGDIFVGGHYTPAWNKVGVINNPYLFSVPAQGVQAVSTTLASGVASPGSQTVQLVSTPLSALYIGELITVDASTSQEQVAVTAVSTVSGNSAFTAVFSQMHGAGAAATNTLAPFATLTLSCENHFTSQAANPGDTAPYVGTTTDNNYSTSSSTSTYPNPGGAYFNEVYATGGVLGASIVRITHTNILGPGNGQGCGNSNVGPFDNLTTNFFSAEAIGDETQDGAIFWWSSTNLGQLGTDANGNPYAAIFMVLLDASTSTALAQMGETLSTSDTLGGSQAGTGPGRTLAESSTTTDAIVAATNPGATGSTGGPPPTVMLLGDHAMAAAGSCSFLLQITAPNGGFTSQSVVNWNGSPRATAYLYPRILRAQINASDLTSTGRVPITVTTPGEGTAAGGTFTVVAGAPTISSYFSLGSTLVVTGANFVPRNTVIVWNGITLQTTWYSPTVVQAWFPPGIINAGGSGISVTNTGCESDY